MLAGLAALPLMGFRSFSGLLAPSARLWPRWQAHDPSSTRVLDWAPLDAWLRDFVVPSSDGINRVRYGAVSDTRRGDLADIIAGLAAEPVSSLNRGEQRTYWINLYNAVTLKVVLDHYPVASIHAIDLSGDLISDGPWKAPLVTIEDEALTLNDIEHRILRPIWPDARIHYAVNCAAIGCPNLRAEAWRPWTLEADLDAAAAAYINHPRGVRVGRCNNQPVLTVSKIYDWYAEDFGGTEVAVLAHFRRYAKGETAKAVAQYIEIHDTAYDWALNDAATAQ